MMYQTQGVVDDPAGRAPQGSSVAAAVSAAKKHATRVLAQKCPKY
jgi:hypothetical protein